MATHAAFLRGINVGKRNVKGPKLVSILEAGGLDDVATFRASGNVVFTAKGGAGAIGRDVEKALKAGLGYEVATFIRTAAQVRKIATAEPFTGAQPGAGKGKVQVVFLAGRPTRRERDAVMALAGADDQLKVQGSELFWLPSGGLMESAIGMNGIGKVVGTNTIRTLGTVAQMAARFFGD